MLTRMMGVLGGLAKVSMPGDSLLNPAPVVIAADAADTVTVEKINSGIIQYTGFTAGRNLTTDTAANIIAAFPEMNVGDAIVIAVSCVAAFAGTWVAGASVTLSGRATTPASSYSLVVITKLSATTVGWRVL